MLFRSVHFLHPGTCSSGSKRVHSELSPRGRKRRCRNLLPATQCRQGSQHARDQQCQASRQVRLHQNNVRLQSPKQAANKGSNRNFTGQRGHEAANAAGQLLIMFRVLLCCLLLLLPQQSHLLFECIHPGLQVLIAVTQVQVFSSSKSKFFCRNARS